MSVHGLKEDTFLVEKERVNYSVEEKSDRKEVTRTARIEQPFSTRD